MIPQSELITILVLLCTLAVGLCVCLAWVLIKSGKLFKLALDKVKAAKEEAEAIRIRTEEKYNKYASMPIEELDGVLMTLFACHLETASLTDVSENDPGAALSLYSVASENLLEYLGQETVDAIDYYYGKNYIVRWCELRYQLLENHGIVSRAVRKEIYAKGIIDAMQNDRIILGGKTGTGG